MQCPRCGYQNAPGTATCRQCGLAVTTAAPQAPYRPQQPGPYGQPGPPAPPGPGQSRPGQWGPGPPSGPPRPDAPGGYPGQSHGSPYPNAPAPVAPYAAGRPGDSGPPTQQWNRPPGHDPSYAASPHSAPPGYAQPAPAYAVGTRVATSAGNRAGALTVLVLAVIAGSGYAGWALLHRRGIFEDFADGTSTMTLNQAKSSDRWDTVLLVVAIVLVAAAVLWWLVLRINAGTAGGSLEIGGFAVVALGIVMAAIGLAMSAGVSSSGTRRDEGDKAASAALIYGLGFAVIALGLVIGIAAVRATSHAVRSFPSHAAY